MNFAGEVLVILQIYALKFDGQVGGFLKVCSPSVPQQRSDMLPRAVNRTPQHLNRDSLMFSLVQDTIYPKSPLLLPAENFRTLSSASQQWNQQSAPFMWSHFQTNEKFLYTHDVHLAGCMVWKSGYLTVLKKFSVLWLKSTSWSQNLNLGKLPSLL